MPNDSPVFQVVKLGEILCRQWSNLDEVEAYVQSKVGEIEHLFRTRAASPHDVGVEKNTLLHVCIFITTFSMTAKILMLV